MFKEKFYADIRKKLYEIMGITLEMFLSCVRMDEKEFDQKLKDLRNDDNYKYIEVRDRWQIALKEIKEENKK